MTEHAPTAPPRPGVLIENPTAEMLDALPIHSVVAVWDVRHEYPAYAFTRHASGWNDQKEWNHSERLADWPNLRVARNYGDDPVVAYELRLVASPISTPPADDVREALADESDFTPSTEQVRSHYVFDQSNVWRPERGRAFDRWLAAEVRPHGTVTEPETEHARWICGKCARFQLTGLDDRPEHHRTCPKHPSRVPDERTPVERFADYAAAQFQSDLDYDGAEVKRRILVSAHILAPDHPKTAAECDVCRDDDKVDGL